MLTTGFGHPPLYPQVSPTRHPPASPYPLRTMSYHNLPPAPAPNILPLPQPQQPPQKKEYSEGSMYETMSPQDIEAWHRRYANYKEWRQEVPVKRIKPGPPGASGSGSTQSFGYAVGVGSADWESSGSDTGTVPTTVMEGRGRERGERGDPQWSPRIAPRAASPAPPPPQSKANRSSHPEAPPLSAPAPPPTQHVPTTAKPPPTRQSTRAPVTAAQASHPPTAPSQPRPPPPTSNHPKTHTHPPTQPPTQPPPGALLVPSPAASATHAEREAYLASVTDLPLQLLSEKQRSEPLPRTGSQAVTASSTMTHVRLDSLLSVRHRDLTPSERERERDKERGKSRGKGGSARSAGSSTTVPSVQSDQQEEVRKAKSAGTARGKDALGRSLVEGARSGREMSAVTLREHHYQTSDHLPVPGASTAKPTVPSPSNATVHCAAQHPLPSSAATSHTERPVEAQRASGTVRTVRTRETTIVAPHPTPVPFDATVTRATQAPLPESNTPTATIAKIPVSVKTTAGSSSVPPSKPGPAAVAATVTQAAKVPLPATTTGGTHRAGSTRQAGSVRGEASAGRPVPTAAPSQVPLPPSTAHPPSLVPGPPAPTHRQQMPLPRPALTPQHSAEGVQLAQSLGRRHRDPSLVDLTARFDGVESPENGVMPVGTPRPPQVDLTVNTSHEPRSNLAPSAPTMPKAPSAKSTRSTRPLDILVHPTTAPPPSPATPLLADAQSRASSAGGKVPAAPPTSPATPLPPASSRQSRGTAAVTVTPQHRHLLIDPPNAYPQPNPLDPGQTQYLTVPGTSEQGQAQVVFSPGSQTTSMGSQDDHVSFEVPQGSRGRLRVTLKWLGNGRRRGSGSAASTGMGFGGAVIAEEPPQVPPKTGEELARARSAGGSGGQVSRQGSQARSRDSGHHHQQQGQEAHHPIVEEHRPALDLAQSKLQRERSREKQFEHEREQHREQELSPSAGMNHLAGGQGYNPYNSMATQLPAYGGPQQVYNMPNMPSMRFAYPQPQAQASGQAGWGFRAGQGALGMNMGLRGDGRNSPARESVDPPSDGSPPMGGMGQLPTMGGYPGMQGGMGMGMGLNGFPKQLGQGQGEGAQGGQGQWWGQQQQQNPQHHQDFQQQQQQQGSRSNIWQRMFGRGDTDTYLTPEEDGIRAWRNRVPPGQAPTLAPPAPPTRAPTIAPTLYRMPSQGFQNPRQRGPQTLPARTYNPGPGTRAPSAWEKLMYRRQVEEHVYASPQGRSRRLPSPAPPLPSYHEQREWDRQRLRTAERTGRLGGFMKRQQLAQELDPYARGRGRGRGEKDARRRAAEREKGQRRKDRARERSEKERRERQEGASKGSGRALSRNVMAKVDERDRPKDVGEGVRVGRSGATVREWVQKVTRNGSSQSPPQSGPNTDYKPWASRLGLKADGGAARLRRQQSGPKRAEEMGHDGQQKPSSGIIGALKKTLTFGRNRTGDRASKGVVNRRR